MANLQIDVDAIRASVNRIDTCITDIATRTQKFIELVEEKNKESGNSVALINTLGDKLQAENENIQKVLEAQNEIKANLQKYIEMLEDATDDGAFR